MMSKLKELSKRILGPRALGRMECVLKPSLRVGCGGPFNGQQVRRRIFDQICSKVPFRAIVETGAYRGTTTALLAKSGLPVYTVEKNPRYFSYTSARFIFRRSKIRVHEGDSRDFLKRLITDPSVPKEGVFFYLDAHWNADLPLREELELIASAWTNSVVMIDDFEVPGTMYGFDDYGVGKRLDMTIFDSPKLNAVHAFFPRAGSEEETGARRGSVVISWDDNVTAILRALPLIRESMRPAVRV